uniref:Uncharacterized protein n=1 Tax=Avena sativa TaxID=4498 RepID=A0ACD5Y4T4_AVESA
MIQALPWSCGPKSRQYLLLRRMEEGEVVYLLSQPPLIRRERYAYYVRIILRCLTPVLSLAIIALLLVLKYKYHEAELQDPLHMAFCLILAICFIPTGYLCTQD